MSRATALKVLLVGTLGASAMAAETTPHPSAVTQHVVHINGHAIAYTATVAENLVQEEYGGAPGAAVVTIAYIRNDTTDFALRPVLFAFNGGPGASSFLLHLSAMGPVLHVGGHRDSGYAENISSPLDVTDLVFIDPVSTGFSRALPRIDRQQWYGGRADAVEVASVINEWLKTNHRENSPVYVAGESYGATRAALIVKYVPELRLNGVLLISGIDWSSNPRVVNFFATMAAGAWYHKKVDRRGLTAEQFYLDALAFARDDYFAALRNTNLQPVELHAMSERVAGYIGLPVALIEKKKLVVLPRDWSFNILKDQGMRAGFMDVRATAKWCPDMRGEDPAGSVHFLPSDTCRTQDKQRSLESLGEDPMVGRYLREQLKFADNDPYYSINASVALLWGKGAEADAQEPTTAQIMAAAMNADHRLRLIAIYGLFDFLSGDGSAFVAAGVPSERFTLLRVAGGHEVYQTDFGEVHNRELFNGAVRTFITSDSYREH